MRLRGFHLLRIAGVQIIIDYSWFIIFFLVIYSVAEVASVPAQKQISNPQYWIMGLVAALLFFASVLLHEFAHCFVAVKLGAQVLSTRLFFWGGMPQVSGEARSARHELLIALAGPATSMAFGLFAGAIWLAYFLGGGPQAVVILTGFLALVNICFLALFNLIPGLPLDGGRILHAILWERWDDVARATKVVSRIGNAVALFLIVIGALLFFLTPNLIIGLWLIFIGLFMKQLSVGSYQAAVVKQALAGVRIRQIMTEHVVSVDWLLPVDELVRDFIYKHQFTNFPVFNRDEFIGMVSLGEVKAIPKELWGFKQVRDIMTPLDHVPSLSPNDDATEALARMVTDDLGRMPVIEDGRLVGIVSRRDIMNLFKIKSDLGAT